MIGQPAPATQELTDELNTYLNRRRKLLDIDLRRLGKKADSLQGKIDASEYSVFLGVIASLRRDAKNVTYNFEKALKLKPSSTKIINYYLTALNSSGQHSEALTQGKKLAKKLNDNGELLIKVIELAFWLGRFHEAQTLLNQLEEPQQCEYYQSIIDAIELVDSVELDDDKMMHFQQLAFSVIPKMNLYFSSASLNIAHNCIHYEIFVDLPVKDIFDVNWELADILVNNTDNAYNDVLMFEYSSIDVFDERRAS